MLANTAIFNSEHKKITKYKYIKANDIISLAVENKYNIKNQEITVLQILTKKNICINFGQTL